MTGAAFLEGAGVKNSKDLAGDAVGDVWDKLECVCEGADNEAIVAAETIRRRRQGADVQPNLQCEWTLDEIKADATGVNNDESWDVSSRFVDYHCS